MTAVRRQISREGQLLPSGGQKVPSARRPEEATVGRRPTYLEDSRGHCDPLVALSKKQASRKSHVAYRAARRALSNDFLADDLEGHNKCSEHFAAVQRHWMWA